MNTWRERKQVSTCRHPTGTQGSHLGRKWGNWGFKSYIWLEDTNTIYKEAAGEVLKGVIQYYCI